MTEALFDGFEPPVAVTPEPIKYTERDVLDHLRRRYTHTAGNGERYVLAEHVRDHGAGAKRTADLMVRDVWDSTGHVLHGFEVKVSRSDWLSELRDPSKAERFKRHCDYWWLAVSDVSIVRDDLPDGWGLVVISGDSMRIRTRAKRLVPEPMPTEMRVSLERSIAKTAKRHAVLDAEQAAAGKCERFVRKSCLDLKKERLCWTCRLTVIGQRAAAPA